VHGKLKGHLFDLKNCTFTLSLQAEKMDAHSPSEIYLPELHFPSTDTVVSVSDGSWEITERVYEKVKLQCLRWRHTEGRVEIKVKGVKCKARESGIDCFKSRKIQNL
jgi:hypothetical protein